MIKTSIPPTIPNGNIESEQQHDDKPSSSSSTPSSSKESVVVNSNEQASSSTTNNEKQSMFSKFFSKKSSKDQKESSPPSAKKTKNEKESISTNTIVPTNATSENEINNNDIISSNEISTPKESTIKKKSDIDFQEKGNIELWNKNYEQALDYFSQALEINSDNIEIHLSKAAVYNSSGLFSNAIKECKVTLEMANKKRNELDDGEDMSEIDQLLSKAYARMSTAYLGIHKFKESKTCLENAITIQQCNEFEDMLTLLQELIDLNNKEAKDLFRLANDAYKSKQYDEAIQLYTESINIDQENNILYSNRSMCFIKLKKYLEALSDSEMAIQIENKYGHHFYLPRYAKGNSLYSLGRYQDALDSYQDALKNRPDSDILKKKIKKTKLKMEKFGPIRDMNQPVESVKKTPVKKQKKKTKGKDNVESIAQEPSLNDSVESNLENSTILENYEMGQSNKEAIQEEQEDENESGLSKVQQLIQRIEKDSPKKVEPKNVLDNPITPKSDDKQVEQQEEQEEEANEEQKEENEANHEEQIEDKQVEQKQIEQEQEQEEEEEVELSSSQ
ncbi:hypothetical protein CYY_002775 [Polysphondylium violaceum]|uniref:Tetratricopeptide-like helical domain-containing protein n=1 Tax=Polysphondylium violaceum TaxID=133409 RepID=A0A8J4Q0Q6_9MYCE|nr:hypothetical protein CYY_002775 [Polysphondylium violaceum]